ncbi:MAG TPA: glycosyltransferase family 4 protein [Acidimicrobiales bacterium]|nr:glycosyltransferase family 4 protein [Acidimicrobiales bacterium]
MTAVHQFVPALLPRDATGDHTLALRDTFRQAGWTSEIYVEAAHDELLGEATYFERYPDHARPGDILLYQLSTASPVADFLLGRDETLVLDYHNITPAEYYRDWEEPTADKVALARRQMAELAPRATLGIADSAFNAAELRARGCPATEVVPILTTIDAWGSRALADPSELSRRKDAHGPGTVLLFVGRLSPNKNQHLLVETLWLYRRWYDPDARLALVGPAITADYAEAVMQYAAELGLAAAVDHGEHLTPAQLAAWYSDADVYVCLSDHEGFCIPLLEAMHFDLPIVALAAGAVPETLGHAGILIEAKRPSLAAAAAHQVRSDPSLAAFLASAGRRRLDAFDGAVARSRFLEVLAALDARRVVRA